MPRASLGPHRAAVRRLTGDTGAPPVFSDDDLDAALDETREYQQYLELTPLLDRATSAYPTFEGGTHWEAPVLYDYRFQTVTPTTADLVAGRFNFEPARTDPYLTAAGWTYDIYGAAAIVLDWWVARLKNEYDVTVGGDSFQRSQKIQNLQAMRGEIAAQSPMAGAIRAVPAYRSDWAGRAKAW